MPKEFCDVSSIFVSLLQGIQSAIRDLSGYLSCRHIFKIYSFYEAVLEAATPGF